MGKVLQYVFQNVAANHTLRVVFAPLVAPTKMQVGWNLVSLAVHPVKSLKNELFQNAASNAFGFNQSYFIAETLKQGFGYWIKYSAATNVPIQGSIVTAETVAVKAGWNLFGSLSSSLAVSTIASIPGGQITSNFFEYDGAYSVADSIEPGRGYWVKVLQDGYLTLLVNSSPAPGQRVRVLLEHDLPPNPPDGFSDSKNTPRAFALAQCFPNPFNPVTTIRYDLPVEADINLRIYNLLGQLVQTLVDGRQSAGFKSVEWDASQFGSGVYFYRIEATGADNPRFLFGDVQKMLLIR
jgi:hypothetical protein